ncbi:hypothetical protein [Gordonia soli]|uniref:hypothetical protein n=1 Tax=Gordonia soli TaxID=320799 RepID=UPI00034A1084|nr:hypothetical protein [Gordonia soli]
MLPQNVWRSGLRKATDGRPGRARRFTTATAVAAVSAAVVLGTAGCGAGQISQTANQLPAVNGASAFLGPLKLRDVLIVYPAQRADEVFGDGGPFELSFVISNESQLVNERLVRITPSRGTVRIDGATDIPAGKALRAGTPAGLLIPEDAPADATERRITVTLSDAGKTVAPGLTTRLDFTFAESGTVRVDTPIDAGARMIRQDKIRQAEDPADQHEGEESGGH